MISAFHYENDPDSDMEASMLDQYTAFEMLTPTEKFKKYVERKIEFEIYKKKSYMDICNFTFECCIRYAIHIMREYLRIQCCLCMEHCILYITYVM